MIEGVIMGLSAFIVIAQLPISRELAKKSLWLFDLTTFIGLFWTVISIRSTSIAISAAVAGLTVTLLLRLWRWTVLR